MSRSKSTPVEPSRFLNTLHLFALVALVIGYPVFCFLRNNPAYILTNSVTPGMVWALLEVIFGGIPSVLALGMLALSLLNRAAYWTAHRIVLCLLVSLSFLTLISRLEICRLGLVPFWLALLPVALCTGIALHEYSTNRFTYTGLAFLAPLALAFPIHFILDDTIAQLLHPNYGTSYVWKPSEEDKPPPPIFMFVLDEFPLVHLLDAQGEIDENRFPNFAAFSKDSTWYSNATTVHDYTLKAVPSILTGRNPIPGDLLPLPQNYPNN